jgi:hypothetical protein
MFKIQNFYDIEVFSCPIISGGAVHFTVSIPKVRSTKAIVSIMHLWALDFLVQKWTNEVQE